MQQHVTQQKNNKFISVLVSWYFRKTISIYHYSMQLGICQYTQSPTIIIITNELILGYCNAEYAPGLSLLQK